MPQAVLIVSKKPFILNWFASIKEAPMCPLIRTWPHALCGLFVFSLVHVHIASLSLFLKKGLRVHVSCSCFRTFSDVRAAEVSYLATHEYI